MNRWFSADYHLGHSNIIKYCGRPFANAHEMNEAIIANHNACVQPDDEFYHLGDFSMMGPGPTIEALKRLNGKKFLLMGNHDKVLRKEEVQYYFNPIPAEHEVIIQDKSASHGRLIIVLSHYAMRVWNKSHWDSWQLYGHSHGKLPDDPALRSIDVGVDCHGFRPISYYEIRDIMAKKTPVNHFTNR